MNLQCLSFPFIPKQSCFIYILKALDRIKQNHPLSDHQIYLTMVALCTYHYRKLCCQSGQTSSSQMKCTQSAPTLLIFTVTTLRGTSGIAAYLCLMSSQSWGGTTLLQLKVTSKQRPMPEVTLTGQSLHRQ